MKRLCALLTVLMLLGSFACAEQTEPLPPSTLITASAAVTLPLTADSALLTLSMTSNGETLSAAESAADAKADSLRDALVAAGAEESAIAYARGEVNASAQYAYNKIAKPQWSTTGFEVQKLLTVHLSDSDAAAMIVDAALLFSSDVTCTITMQCSQTEEIYRQALAEAAQNAMQQAQALALACGLTVEGVASVTELPRPQAGEMEISAEVQVCLNVR